MTATPTTKSLERAALQLHPDAKVKLAHALVLSLRDLPRDQLEALWLAEAERRDEEMESGEVVGIPGEEFFDRLEQRYDR